MPNYSLEVKTQLRKNAKNDYYVNDDLFPEKVKKELQPDDQKKNTADDSDYYVNDDLVPENTKNEFSFLFNQKEIYKEGK